MSHSGRDGIRRRSLLIGGSALACLGWLPLRALATPEEVDDKIKGLFGDRVPQEGRVTVTTPAISENGYSVPFGVEVESPMTEEDFVRRIAVFAPKNPLPNVAMFELGPYAGRAKIDTRIRMGDSQRIIAIAEMNDGSLWSGYSFSVVTLAACVL